MELGFWISIINVISDSLSCIPVFRLLGARWRMRLIVERTLKNRFYGRFPFNLKFRKIGLAHQMDPSISVWSDRNIQDQLWRWSTLTVLVISVGRSHRNVFFHLTKPLFPVPLICILLSRTITELYLRWRLSRVYCSIGRVKFPKFHTGIFVEWKAPYVFAFLGRTKHAAIGQLRSQHKRR